MLISVLLLEPRRFFPYVYGLAIMWAVLVMMFMLTVFNLKTEPHEFNLSRFLTFVLYYPFFETLFIHCILQNSLRRYVGVFYSIVITAVVFDLLHWPSIIQMIFVLGLVVSLCLTFEYARRRNGQLVAFLITLAWHMSWNGCIKVVGDVFNVK